MKLSLVTITMDQRYHWEHARPLYNYLREQEACRVIVLTFEKFKYQAFPGLNPNDVVFVEDNFVRIPIDKKVDINFSTNYLSVDKTLNVFINHGCAPKHINSDLQIPYPHVCMVPQKFRYEGFLMLQKFGQLRFQNDSIRSEFFPHFVPSAAVDFEWVGNLTKLDPFYQGLVAEMSWPIAEGQKRLLFAPTFSSRAFYGDLCDLKIASEFDVLLKTHALDQLAVKQFKFADAGAGSLELLAAADVVVSDSSSVLYEAVLLGKKVIRLTNADAAIGARKNMGFRQVPNKVELELFKPLWNEMLLSDLENIHYEELSFPDQALLKEHFPRQDGSASQAVVELAKKHLKQAD